MRIVPTLIACAVVVQAGTLVSDHAVVEAFAATFMESVPRPALYHDRKRICGTVADVPSTATAYLPAEGSSARLMILRVVKGEVVAHANRSVLRPSGRIRVLVLLVRYPETIGKDAERDWHVAQIGINDDHRKFADSRGLKTPIVTFANTNVWIERTDLVNPRDNRSARSAAEIKGYHLRDYDVTVMIDFDPKTLAGGQAFLGLRHIYVGRYGDWKSPLNATQWGYVAQTTYHHEMAHLWGWQHEWSPRCGREVMPFAPFPAATALFGWDDVDGDGVPEILDDTPYGRQ